MRQAVVASDPWAERRRRTDELKERWPFAAEVLTFYRALLAIQEDAFVVARREPPEPSRVAAYTAERVVPRVVEVSIGSGPRILSEGLNKRSINAAGREEIVSRWLAGGDLSAIDRYTARASAGPVLEALGPAAGAPCAGAGRRDPRHCPVCGGPPQLTWFGAVSEDLVTPHRYLLCARCASSWSYPRMTCAACGEKDPSQLPILGEEGTAHAEVAGHAVRGVAGTRRDLPPEKVPRFPHIRIDACDTCSRYMLSIDLGRDPRAVPLVDEMAAIPLDLYARERGMTKIVPNLMGV